MMDLVNISLRIVRHLNGRHDRPLEHHERCGREHSQGGPRQQVRPEGDGRVEGDAGLGVGTNL